MIDKQKDRAKIDRVSGRVEQLAKEVLPDASFYVVDVEVKGPSGRRVVNVYVDADAGITIKQCETISRALSFLIETADLIRGAYRLNVSSPGLDRPLRLPRQFRKNVGRPVQVKYHVEGEETAATSGHLKEATEEGILLEVKTEQIPLRYEEIVQATVELPW